MSSLDLETRPLEGCVFVRAPGPRLDAASSPLLRNAVVDLANAGHLRVVLSLAALEQIDSSGLGTLIALHKTLEPPRGRLVLCDVPAKIQPILKLTRLDRILAQASDADAAAALARAV
ncbi:MAG: STAS domain-containing protein [Burkholderiales bacterium]|nr:STAS domain-containing protein [Opitutaceae bacterium]